MSIIELMLVVFIINLPFGYWRFNAARFSRQWMMAIHIPVPFVFLLRIVSGFGWKVIPLLMVSFAAGQFAGGKLRKIYTH
ncbi:MAG: hypothetical protein FIB08_15360 [Candidatus Methanoperedens sp.]|nr:hypothetical protein [Candidatus Methanoperedens sp.]